MQYVPVWMLRGSDRRLAMLSGDLGHVWVVGTPYKAVDRGAALLDRKKRGWAKSVDPLEIWGNNLLVLVFGSQLLGCAKLEFPCMSWCGFSVPWWLDYQTRELWQVQLQDAWRIAVEDRR